MTKNIMFENVLQKKYNWRFFLVFFIFLFCLNLVFYAINLNDFFLSDDFDWLYLTKTQSYPLSHYFSSNYFGEQGLGGAYRPMVNVLFFLNYKIGGLNPLPYHLTSILFHTGVCFLIFFIAKEIFFEDPKKEKIGILSAIFFAVLPNHSEAVIWISAMADPFASFFYLLSFYLYMVFRREKKFFFILFSFFCFILSLLAKEIAVTLPVLILAYELYLNYRDKKFDLKKIIVNNFIYWILLALYFAIRFFSIKVFFGYYAEKNIDVSWQKLGKAYEMFVSLFSNLLLYEKWRVLATDFFIGQKIIFAIIFAVIFLLLAYKKETRDKIVFLFIAYFILIIPVLFLNYNHFNDEGERYNYLPSFAFCLLLGLVLAYSKKIITIPLFIFLIIYFSWFLWDKNLNWNKSAEISSQMILQDFPKAVDLNKSNETIIFIGMPDTFEGVPLFRNAIVLAVKIYYPKYIFSGENLNAYVRLNENNYN